MLEQWVTLPPHSSRVLDSILSSGNCLLEFSMCSFGFPPDSPCFPSHPKLYISRWTDYTKLALAINECANRSV